MSAPHATQSTGIDEEGVAAVPASCTAHGSSYPAEHPQKAEAISVVPSEPPADEGAASESPRPLPTHHANGLVDQTSYMPFRSIIVCFLSMQLTVLIYFLEQTIISTALPNISAAFNAGRSSSFVAAAYLLTSSAMQPVWGRLSDVFGRKVTLLTCLTIFLIGSLACALAQTMLQLIIFRGMQGFGGGGLLTLVFIIVSDIVSLKNRGVYQAATSQMVSTSPPSAFSGITEVSIMIGNGTGPVLGGVLAERLGWRWCFWINLPVGGAAFLALLLFLPLKPVKGRMKEKLKKVDYGGALLTLAATVLVILPLNWGGTSFPWVSGPVLGCLLSGIVLFAVFALYEWKVPKVPVVPPFIFRNQTVSVVFVTTFFSGATTLVQTYYLPQYFQVARGKGAILSGVLIIPQLVTVTLMVAVSGIVVSRTGQYKPLVFVGFAVWTVGLGLLSTLNEHSSMARIVGFQLLNGAGQGCTLQTTVVAAQAAVERSEMSVVTSVRNFVRALGGTVFLVVASTIINNTLRSHLTSHGFSASTISSIIDDPTAIWRSATNAEGPLTSLSSSAKTTIVQSYVAGFHKLFYVHAALIGACFVIALFGVGQHSLTREEDAELKERGREWVKSRQKKGRKNGADEVEKGGQAEKGEEGGAVDRDARR
ncbi:hypothetical protein JCM8097_002002 [Rhodosporidiobolus ruineniae]